MVRPPNIPIIMAVTKGIMGTRRATMSDMMIAIAVAAIITIVAITRSSLYL